MGRPYLEELKSLQNTYLWAINYTDKRLSEFVRLSLNSSLISIGSGGASTSGYIAGLLHELSGGIAKSITPLELVQNTGIVKDESVMIISASGRNNDILTAFRKAVVSSPKNIIGLSTKKNSPLSKLASEYRSSFFCELNIPSKKDGFLATNSLLALSSVLIKAYSPYITENIKFPKDLVCTNDLIKELKIHQKCFNKRNSWIVIYGTMGSVAAKDLESKFSEAALGNIILADFRNFAHGRHYWFAKRGSSSGVIALTIPDEEIIAEKTLSLLPSNVAKIRLSSIYSGPIGALDLLIKALHLVYIAGTAINQDPGRPMVPEFGRKIYHLKMYNIAKSHNNEKQNIFNVNTAITRKSKLSFNTLDKQAIAYWNVNFNNFKKKIMEACFGVIVFDYDGTLVDNNERYSGPCKEIKHLLLQILKKRVIVGIATGRGISVKNDLRKFIPGKYWNSILIGYYNGSDIGWLNDEKYPLKEQSVDKKIEKISSFIKENIFLTSLCRVKYYPKQISILPLNMKYWQQIRDFLSTFIFENKLYGVQVLESCHSFDIIAPGVSKMNVVNTLNKIIKESGKKNNILCIGDKGEWPGNDYQLLSSPYSLSVDTVSSSPSTCWNISKQGFKGVQATLQYLNAISFECIGAFKFTCSLGNNKKEKLTKSDLNSCCKKSGNKANLYYIK